MGIGEATDVLYTLLPVVAGSATMVHCWIESLFAPEISNEEILAPGSCAITAFPSQHKIRSLGIKK